MESQVCDWCGHEQDARAYVNQEAGARAFRGFRPQAGHCKEGAYGCAAPMQACSECQPRAERFAKLTNQGCEDGKALLTVSANGRPPVTLKDAKAARAYLKEAIGFKRAAKPAKAKSASASVSAAQAREIATVALSLIGMSFPRTPAEADAILEELSAGVAA